MLHEIAKKHTRLVVGMMSGTSVDGVDAALVEITGGGFSPKVRLRCFESNPFPAAVREEIFRLFQPEYATVDRVGAMNFRLGACYADAALSLLRKAGVSALDVDLIGSHGQTIYHQPEPVTVLGRSLRYTVQIGEGAVIATQTGVPTVSDFRVADVAAGGLGAPLVPFTEYLLYRQAQETVLLQNIGGIGNLTVLPAGAPPEKVYAFDTGPGNMIVDAVVSALTDGRQTFDMDGAMAAGGSVNQALLNVLMQHPYYARPLPKTTGREQFGVQYTKALLSDAAAQGVSPADLVATVTDLTAWSIADAYARYVWRRDPARKLIVGGGGSRNRTLLAYLNRRFAPYGVSVQTQEALGLDSDAKEAVAFALLADCCIRETANSLPSVTGAHKPSIMGKISLPYR